MLALSWSPDLYGRTILKGPSFCRTCTYGSDLKDLGEPQIYLTVAS